MIDGLGWAYALIRQGFRTFEWFESLQGWPVPLYLKKHPFAAYVIQGAVEPDSRVVAKAEHNNGSAVANRQSIISKTIPG
jgi:hypothetical protein